MEESEEHELVRGYLSEGGGTSSQLEEDDEAVSDSLDDDGNADSPPVCARKLCVCVHAWLLR